MGFLRVLDAALLFGSAVLLSSAASAQSNPLPTLHHDYVHDSGWHENTSALAEVIISFEVTIPNATWLRLYFEEVALPGELWDGSGALLCLTSLSDGGTQQLSSRHVGEWQNSSAYLNGDTVLVEVLAQPGTGWSRVSMRSVDSGFTVAGQRSQCGPTDDRVLSSDPRVARIETVGCTGWLIDDCGGCLLTAGHCMSGAGIAEFNVPLSTAGGGAVHPPPDDQYAIDAASLQGNGGGVPGDDWAYFGVFANPNTGLKPAQAQAGAFALALPPTPSGNEIRITGHGVDTSPPEWNTVQQTAVGPMATNLGTLVEYRTDTRPGNSGGPVIWEQTGEAVGIHTHGGCTGSSGQNSGTGMSHPYLQAALAAPTGVCRAGIVPVPPLPATMLPRTTATVEVTILGTLTTGSDVLLNYRTQPGAFTPTVMTSLGASMYRAELPEALCGDAPEYYFSYDEVLCGIVTSPSDAPASLHSVAVGSVQASFSDDFESDQGWTPSTIGASSGTWTRGVPVNDPNSPYDPIAASGGTGSCYLTDNSLGNSDVDGGAVRLTSPVFDYSVPGDTLSYDYYLYLSDASGSDRILVEGRSGTGAWRTVVVHDTHGGLDWRSQVITQADLSSVGVTPSSQVQLRFTVNDADPQSTVEAGLDSFVVGALTCSNSFGTPFCFGDGSDGAFCPCGNSPAAGSAGGCLNGTGLGALILDSGDPSVSADTLVLTVMQAVPFEFGIFVQNTAPGGPTPFYNGVLCLPLDSHLVRHYAPPVVLPTVTDGTGTGVSAQALTLGDYLGDTQPGATLYYQFWGRDNLGPCGTGANFSSGLGIAWTP